MPQYSYKASDEKGKIKSGTIFAYNDDDLREKLRQDNLYLLEINEGQKYALLEALQTSQPGGLSRKQLIEFSNNIGIMLNAGVPLITALEELREDADNKYIQKMLGEVTESIQGGDSLNAALGKRVSDFPELYVSLVKIGEETGRLSDIFFNCAKHYKRIDDLIKSSRKAMLYPAFVMVALVLAAFVFLALVFPPLFELLYDLGVELPLITKIVMAISMGLKDHWFLITMGVILFIALIIALRRHKPSRYWFDWAEIKIPILKRLMIQLRMTFFLRYLALLLNAGVDILRGLELANASTNNLVVQEKMAEARQKVIEGEQFSRSLKQIDFVPNTVIRMISVGETSGTLSEQMDYLADVYNEELERRIDAAIAMLEPVLIFIMAGLALALVMAVLLPLYNMVSTISTSAGQ
ncbi:MAG: type II secretion system F family protein [Desulfobacteraceae bacterium]|nr:type II secretion system F family protein [Desulfobacteraceae bacterium]